MSSKRQCLSPAQGPVLLLTRIEVSTSGSVAAETAPAADADITSGLSLCVQPAAEEEGPPVCLCSYLHLQTLTDPPRTPNLHLPPPPPQEEERAWKCLHRFLLRKQALNALHYYD
ncbi:hypothetical protein NDU88_008147 [Pleurodeles waltl]|uniref:Uncharacterized protein n=1 Tax=Pleurodeles waltl TaxID=8319 RepID=A0AAV7SUE1_PLEWA|nr:hypothetical protein NDU88_008147 [Pleurodeles waltl]